MPYIVAKFDPNDAPGQPLWKRTIPINVGAEGFSRVSIHSYQIAGIQSPAPSPAFLRILNQPTTPVYGNGPGGFPLVITTTPNGDFGAENTNQIVVCEGDNVWNNAKYLDLELVDFFGLPYQFQAAIIVFELIPRDPHFAIKEKNAASDEVRRPLVKEPVTRNFLPGTTWMRQG